MTTFHDNCRTVFIGHRFDMTVNGILYDAPQHREIKLKDVLYFINSEPIDELKNGVLIRTYKVQEV